MRESYMAYRFPCGCVFETKGHRPDGKPAVLFDPYKVNFNCSHTWDLLEKGLTKGIFQLESNLGKSWCKKLAPKNIEHIGALGAVLRPGCLEAITENGKSVTETYCMRKNELEPTSYYHIGLEDILNESYGLMIYQEQAIKIAQKLFGFSETEADSLRKAIGKKIAEEMAKSEKLCYQKAKELGILNDEEIKFIFDQIKKSQRYSFNKSHSISYGIIGYITAYLKTHFPLEFFANWLFYAKDKQDTYTEMRDLIDEAKRFNIEVHTPDITLKNSGFVIHDESIYFGLGDIKNIGEKAVEKLKDLHISKRMSWMEFLFVSDAIGQSVTKTMIQAGAVKIFNKSRNEMVYEIDKWNKLTDTEKAILKTKDFRDKTLLQVFKEYGSVKKDGGILSNKTRVAKVEDLIKSLEIPSSPLYDSIEWLAKTENELLGIPITCIKSDAYSATMANCTCIEVDTTSRQSVVIAAELEEVTEKTIGKGSSKGQKMASCKVRDSTGCTQVLFFADSYSTVKNDLVEGNLLLIEGSRNKKDFGLIGKNVHIIYE